MGGKVFLIARPLSLRERAVTVAFSGANEE